MAIQSLPNKSCKWYLVVCIIVLILLPQAGFVAVDAVTGLKLIEGGLHKETMAFVGLAAIPIQVILPAVLRYIFLLGYTYARIIIWTWHTKYFYSSHTSTYIIVLISTFQGT